MAFRRRNSAGRPAGVGKPPSPGKSASAPGRVFKGMGLSNASTIAPGKTRVSVKPSRVPPRY